MNQYTWEYLAECGEFEHGQTFVTVEDFEKEVVFKQDKIKQLEQELQKTRDILKGLVESIYAPYRIGIAVKPNENWKALNDANELISFFKDKQGE